MHAEYRDELLHLLASHAYLERKLTLTSGRSANYYFDCKRILYLPRGAFLVGELLIELVRDSEIGQVGGMAAGALPVTDAVIAAAHRHSVDVTGFFVRKDAKTHGLQQRIEGVLRTGVRTGVIDDTITTGGSSLEAMAVVREAGAQVVAAFAIVDRGEGAREAFARQGLSYTYLYSGDEVRAAHT
jgi:orotate phosphoribosyltransferase